MRITESQLRRIIRESIIFEGFKDDQRYLIEKYPDHAGKIKDLGTKWVAWLIARFGESARIEETHPFDDAIATVLKFSRKDAAIGEKYRSNEQFRNSIDTRFPPDARSWSSPADTAGMTSEEMEIILRLSERKKQRIDVNEAGDIEGDRVGKVGPWNLFMPTTRENSCKIVSDPITGEPNVNWCTASTTQNNPFYKYVAEPNSSVLFTLVRDKHERRGDANDFMSLGFHKSKLVTSNQEASITVDGENMGLSLPRIRSILGPDFDEIMRILKEKIQSLSGVHPSVKKFKDAAKSVSALEYFLRGLGGQEAASSKKTIAQQEYTTEEVLIHLSADKSEMVRRAVAENLNLPLEYLVKLSSDESEEVRLGVANNKNITPDIAERLSNDNIFIVRSAVAQNRKIGSSALTRLASDESSAVRTGAARNPKTSPEVLAKLLNDEDDFVAAAAAKNEKTPIDAIIRLSKSQDEKKRVTALLAKNLPEDVLIDLSKDPSRLVRQRAMSDEKMRSIDWLSRFLNDEEQDIRNAANYYIKKLEKKSKDVKVENLLRNLIRRVR